MKDLRFAWGLARRRPFSVLVQITNRCNMTCPFCAFWRHPAKPPDELSVAELQRVSAELAEHGTFLVSIEGGEPTLRPDLPQIVAAFAEHHLVLLYTNGWRMTDALARELWEAGLHQVGVSIDFADDAHDQKRGLKGARERAWAAVNLLKQTAPRSPRQVHVMTVLMAENREHWELLLEQSARAGVCHAFTLLATAGERRTANEAVPAEADLRALAEKHGRSDRVMVPSGYLQGAADFLAEGTLPRCRAGVQSLNIDHLGQVSPCIEKIGQPVGSVRESSISTLLQALVQADAGAGCQDCWTLCRGIAQSWGEGGSVSSWLDLATRMRI